MSTLNVDPTAKIDGTVLHGDNVYVAEGSVLRSQAGSIEFGNASSVLENSVLIGTRENPVRIGSKTVLGHKCLVLGARIGDLCEIGNGSILLPGSQIGDLCIFGEGTLIKEGVAIPDGSVVLGRPGKIIRQVMESDLAMIDRMRGHDMALSPVIPQQSQFAINKGAAMKTNLHEFNGKIPIVSAAALIYETAELTGDVVVGDGSVIAAGVRIIGNSHGPVRIGSNVHIMENSVLHLLPDNHLIIHDNVTIGPGCIIHGTEIEDGCVIESGAIVCDYSHLGRNVLVKAGSLVKQRQVVEDNAIVEGFPAREIGKTLARLEKPDWAIRLPLSSQGTK